MQGATPGQEKEMSEVMNKNMEMEKKMHPFETVHGRHDSARASLLIAPRN